MVIFKIRNYGYFLKLIKKDYNYIILKQVFFFKKLLFS